MELRTKKIIGIGLLLHLLAGIFSIGTHHYDEHFQIFEFLNYKLGHIESSNLVWEYGAQIRPWFQVGIYFVISKIALLFGIASPLWHSTIIRIFTSLFGYAALLSLIPTLERWSGKEKNQKTTNLYVCLATLLWFIPYIQARTSSENLGGAFLLLGLAFFFSDREKKSSHLFSGLLLGLAFVCRFQIGVMVATLWFWSLFFEKKGPKLFFYAVGVIIAVGIGFLSDYWGYGQWSFSPYNYFVVNLLEGKAAEFGTHPIWHYFHKSFIKGVPPISLIFMFSYLMLWIRKPKSVVTWLTLPFFAVHCLIGHKELRFIFPLFTLIPLVWVHFLGQFKENFQVISHHGWIRKLIGFSIFVNILVLIVVTFKPASTTEGFYRYMYSSGIKNLTVIEEDPYSFGGNQVSYFFPPDLEIEKVDIYGVDKTLFGYYFVKHANNLEKINTWGCETIYSSIPDFIFKKLPIKRQRRLKTWTVMKCGN